MKVKEAKERIKKIEKLTEEISKLYTPDTYEYDLLLEAVSYLGMFTKALYAAIDEAELKV